MSAYPLPSVLEQLQGSEFVPFDDTKLQTSPGGRRRIIEPYRTATRGRIGEITLKHEIVDTDTTIDDHYAANLRIRFDVVMADRPTITWECLYLDAPQYEVLSTDATVLIATVSLVAISNDE